MSNAKKKAVVIGGGIHGLTSALALAREGIETTLLEKRDDLLAGTSGATHNRAHMGYHYPRSIETALECIEGLNFFKANYPEVLFYPESAYYLIEKRESKTSVADFEKFCSQVKIPYEIQTDSNGFWNEENIICGFKVPEPIFDLEVFKEILKKEAQKLGLEIIMNTEVIGLEQRNNIYQIIAKGKEATKKYEADIIINATYAYTNNTMRALGLEEDMTKYELQKTEVIVARSAKPLPALTVMDGPFVSIMPLASDKGKNLFLIYDVGHSVIDKEDGHFLDDTKVYPTNFDKMIEHGKKYYPFMGELEYVTSQYGSRPIPQESLGDSRKTRIISHSKKPGIFSILEGKFISAPIIAQELMAQLKKEGFLL